MSFRTLGFIAMQLMFCLCVPQTFATTTTLSDVPVYLTQALPPMVMLNISRDHQLFFKAYNDYSDLDGDGARELTYKHSIDYYGYFDSYKCYSYNGTQFNPAANVDGSKYCDPTAQTWSGNFLNWVAMSRLDILREVLYGGKRSTDTATATVLERAPIPTDAHSWAKYYNGSDIRKLTPFSPLNAAPIYTGGTVNTTSSSKPTVITGITGVFYPGDQITVANGTNNTFKSVVVSYSGTTLNVSTAVDAAALTGTFATNNVVSVTNFSRTGISFCNSTVDLNNNFSDTTTQPPVIRVAQGNYALWSANERWQCYWSSEQAGSDDINAAVATNGNQLLVTGLSASRRNPPNNTFSGTTEFIARVSVCNSSLIGHENCRNYGTSLKPAGLLQRDGEGLTPTLYFGLMMSSYTRNISGGVLRKSIGKSLSGNTTASDDEINPADGTLTTTFGIIRTLDALKIYGYAYGSGGTGIYNNHDNCIWQLAGITATATTFTAGEGSCVSWGNPLSEIYLESLRYLAGKTANPSFSFTYSGSKDAVIFGAGNPPVPWGTGPLTSSNYCSALNVLVVNASVSSYDGDQMTLFSDLNPPSGVTAATVTKQIGDLEGLTGHPAPVGSNGTNPPDACTAKSITDLGLVTGICPEAPMQLGTYLIAGTAYYAHTNRIRTDFTPPATDTTSLKVKTYGIALATNVPRIDIPLPGGKKVQIIPAFNQQLSSSPPVFAPGTIVDFKVITENAGVSGTYYVIWEDSAQGGDFDQDVAGIISYGVSTSGSVTTITVTTRVFASSTGGAPMGFGYAINGTLKDGVHYHSGINSFSYTDPGVTACGGSISCVVGAPATSSAFIVGGSGIATLNDPLYYAAKYGGFTDSNNNNQPDLNSEWDADGNNSPDTYYYVNNPGTLADSLNKAFVALAATSSAASVVTNFSTLRFGSVAYQATYNPKDWTGSLAAYSIDPTTLAFTPLWDAKSVLPAANSRSILSYDPASSVGGIPFRFASLSAAQQALLSSDVVNYLRGDSSKEIPPNGTGLFRARSSKLGDSVDSNPIYVGIPSGEYSNPGKYGFSYAASSYYNFLDAQRGRTPMVYLGGNDGMLHGFRASDGVEQLAYVPNIVMSNLPLLTSASYSHKFYVDGSPEVADAMIGSSWKTILVGGLRAGGRGVYMLDVTNPSAFNESSASSVVIGDFDAATDSDIGYVYGQPQIVQLTNGKWAALVGNGYNSTGGKAVLFIIYLSKTGSRWQATDYLKMTTGVGSTIDPNGLAGVNAVDTNNDGKVDVAYAGDLQGNLWRFDLSSAGLGQSSGVTNLISACTDNSSTCPTANRQAIIHTPEIGRHPNGKDYIVYFGTGSDLSIGDLLDKRTQSVYGVWDRGTGAKINRSALLSQIISSATGGRQITNNSIVWLNAALTPVNLGWVENLPDSGERMVGDPGLNSGILFYNTFVSSANPCDMAGYGYLMAVAYQNGGSLAAPLFDSNGDGQINASDSILAGVKVNSVASSSIIDTIGSGNYAYAISSLVYPVSSGSSSSTSSAGSSAGSASSAGSSAASSAGSSAGSSTPADWSKTLGSQGGPTTKDLPAGGCANNAGNGNISVVCTKPPPGAARLGWREIRNQ